MEYKEFKAVSAEEWRNKIIKDLKGKDYDSLTSADRNGIKMFPDHSEIRSNDPHIANSSWEWRQDFDCSDPKRANKQILESLTGGCNSIGLHHLDPNQISAVLSGVHPQYIRLNFGLTDDPFSLIEELDNWLHALEVSKDEINGNFGFDPIGYALSTGSWSKFGKVERIAELLEATKDWPGMKPFNVRADIYHNGGASQSTELGLAIAQGHELLAALTEAGIEPERAYHSIAFTLGIGSDYLAEIAKFRSIRLLWENIGMNYSDSKALMPVQIHAITGETNLSTMDEHNNLLRTTGEAMSAIIGGADSVSISTFSKLTKERDPHGERWARNIHHLLREESHLNEVVDPAKGSHFIEYMTEELCLKAWDKFKSVDSEGGLLSGIQKGTVQDLVESDRNAFMESVKDGKNVLIGVNKYPNADEEAKDALEADLPSGNDIAAITPFRVALEDEKKIEVDETH